MSICLCQHSATEFAQLLAGEDRPLAFELRYTAALQSGTIVLTAHNRQII